MTEARFTGVDFNNHYPIFEQRITVQANHEVDIPLGYESEVDEKTRAVALKKLQDLLEESRLNKKKEAEARIIESIERVSKSSNMFDSENAIFGIYTSEEANVWLREFEEIVKVPRWGKPDKVNQ